MWSFLSNNTGGFMCIIHTLISYNEYCEETDVNNHKYIKYYMSISCQRILHHPYFVLGIAVFEFTEYISKTIMCESYININVILKN